MKRASGCLRIKTLRWCSTFWFVELSQKRIFTHESQINEGRFPPVHLCPCFHEFNEETKSNGMCTNTTHLNSIYSHPPETYPRINRVRKWDINAHLMSVSLSLTHLVQCKAKANACQTRTSVVNVALRGFVLAHNVNAAYVIVNIEIKACSESRDENPTSLCMRSISSAVSNALQQRAPAIPHHHQKRASWCLKPHFGVMGASGCLTS